jgi:hypothetical protein
MAIPSVVRLPLYLDFAAGEVKEFVGATDTMEIYSTVYTKVHTYTGTGSEGNPFNVPTLDGKIVVAVVRAGVVKRITDGAVPDYETLKITGTLMEDDKGIEASGGDVTLYTGDALIAGEKVDFIYYG